MNTANEPSPSNGAATPADRSKVAPDHDTEPVYTPLDPIIEDREPGETPVPPKLAPGAPVPAKDAANAPRGAAKGDDDVMSQKPGQRP